MPPIPNKSPYHDAELYLNRKWQRGDVPLMILLLTSFIIGFLLFMSLYVAIYFCYYYRKERIYIRNAERTIKRRARKDAAMRRKIERRRVVAEILNMRISTCGHHKKVVRIMQRSLPAAVGSKTMQHLKEKSNIRLRAISLIVTEKLSPIDVTDIKHLLIKNKQDQAGRNPQRIDKSGPLMRNSLLSSKIISGNSSDSCSEGACINQEDIQRRLAEAISEDEGGSSSDLVDDADGTQFNDFWDINDEVDVGAEEDDDGPDDDDDEEDDEEENENNNTCSNDDMEDDNEDNMFDDNISEGDVVSLSEDNGYDNQEQDLSFDQDYEVEDMDLYDVDDIEDDQDVVDLEVEDCYNFDDGDVMEQGGDEYFF